MLFELLLVGGGYLLGKAFGQSTKATAATATAAHKPSAEHRFNPYEADISVTMSGSYVNNDGWTYGIQHVWSRKGHFVKHWLINPEPYKHEKHLTFEGAPVAKTDDFFELGYIYYAMCQAIHDGANISRKYGFELDSVKISISQINRVDAQYVFGVDSDADWLEVKENLLVCHDGCTGAVTKFSTDGTAVYGNTMCEE